MVDFALQLADGLIIPVTVAESAFNDLRQRTHAVERLKLQHLNTLYFLHARIGVFIQQRIQHRLRGVGVFGEVVAFTHVLRPLFAG